MEGGLKMTNEVNTIPHTIAQIVKGTTAEFSHYKEGQLFYTVDVEGYRYEFPIQTIETKSKHLPEGLLFYLELSSDIGESTFERTYKAITLMRYIRKAIADGNIRYDKIV